jgi:hypothetical protein
MIDPIGHGTVSGLLNSDFSSRIVLLMLAVIGYPPEVRHNDT